jgi:hypothetical protein
MEASLFRAFYRNLRFPGGYITELCQFAISVKLLLALPIRNLAEVVIFYGLDLEGVEPSSLILIKSSTTCLFCFNFCLLLYKQTHKQYINIL